jgi:hypothetical protein
MYDKSSEIVHTMDKWCDTKSGGSTNCEKVAKGLKTGGRISKRAGKLLSRLSLGVLLLPIPGARPVGLALNRIGRGLQITGKAMIRGSKLVKKADKMLDKLVTFYKKADPWVDAVLPKED